MSTMNPTRKTIFLSFATQKGGAGKTTTTMQTASILAALTDYKVAVLDLDPQESLSNKREREWDEMITSQTASVTANGKAYVKMRAKGRDRFEVVKLDIFPDGDTEADRRHNWATSIAAKLEKLRTSGDYDLVFFDFPGVTAIQQIVDTLSLVDYFFVPFYVDENTIESSMTFVNTVLELKGSGTTKIKGLTAYMWKYAKNKNVAEFTSIADSLKQIDVMVMENKVYESLEVERNRSTINPFDLSGEKSHKPFVDEVLKIVGLQK